MKINNSLDVAKWEKLECVCNMDKETEEMYRTQGIIHTIKDGVVFENKNLMREVERIVKESKKDAGPDIVTEPFK
mgnify:CR=1 FL=1